MAQCSWLSAWRGWWLSRVLPCLPSDVLICSFLKISTISFELNLEWGRQPTCSPTWANGLGCPWHTVCTHSGTCLCMEPAGFRLAGVRITGKDTAAWTNRAQRRSPQVQSLGVGSVRCLGGRGLSQVPGDTWLTSQYHGAGPFQVSLRSSSSSMA